MSYANVRTSLSLQYIWVWKGGHFHMHFEFVGLPTAAIILCGVEKERTLKQEFPKLGPIRSANFVLTPSGPRSVDAGSHANSANLR